MYHTPIYLNVAYLSIRLLSWIALWVTACFLTCMHRQGRNKGWQLHRYIILVLSSTLVQEFLLWLLGIAREHHASAFSHIYLVLVFFSDLTEALFLMLILMVAAGFCITSDSFQQHASKVLCIPPTYFVTCLVVDYTLYAIMEQPKYWTEDGEQVDFSKLVNVLALVLAWVYVIDITNTERAALRRALAPRAGMGDSAAAISAAGGYGEDKQQPGDLLPAGAPRSDAEPLGAGLEPAFADAPQACEDEEAQVEAELGNVQDMLVRQRKLLLLDRFAYAIVTYWVLTALVLLVPVWNEAATVNRLIACLQALVYWLFMAALTFIFRPVKDNPYLMLGSDGGDDGELPEAAATAIEFDEATPAHAASGEIRERPLGEPHMRRFSLGEDSEEGV